MPRKSNKRAKSQRKLTTAHKQYMSAIALGIFLMVLFVLDVTTDSSTPTGAVVAQVEEPDVASEVEVEPQPHIDPAIVSPAAGSTVSGSFTVKVDVPSYANDCYVAVFDNEAIKWDRRIRTCGADFIVQNEWCQTSGSNTCKVQYNINYDDYTTKKTFATFSRP